MKASVFENIKLLPGLYSAQACRSSAPELYLAQACYSSAPEQLLPPYSTLCLASCSHCLRRVSGRRNHNQFCGGSNICLSHKIKQPQIAKQHTLKQEWQVVSPEGLKWCWYPLPWPRSDVQGSHLRGKRCLVLVMAEKFLRMERGKWKFEAQTDLHAHIVVICIYCCWVTWVDVAANNG